VHSVRPAHRVGPDGHTITDLVVEMTQRRRGYFSRTVQRKVDAGEIKPPPPDFIFRGGCTLLIDLETGTVRYSIGKGIDSQRRLEAQRRFLIKPHNPSLQATYFGDPRRNYFEDIGGDAAVEPFALLHRSLDQQEVI